MKKYIVVGVVVIVYVVLFLRQFPSIDPNLSRFSVACPDAFGHSQGGFGEIAGKFMTPLEKTGKSPRNWSYTINDTAWDVVSKVICSEGTNNPQALLKTVQDHVTAPEILTAHSRAVNYTVEMTGPVYAPSWGVYTLKVAALVIIVGILVVVV